MNKELLPLLDMLLKDSLMKTFFFFLVLEGRVGDMERKACQALCKLRIEGDDAKEVCILSCTSSFYCKVYFTCFFNNSFDV